jgi:cyclopropane fatty-acyl-phospholipid synthase-like methyltransferase
MTIEMMEHMKNYEAIFHKISTWLKPNKEAKTGEALLFVHIFCHKDTPSVSSPSRTSLILTRRFQIPL